MALALPYSILHFKQSETTEIKAVIIIGRHGEVAPDREMYFEISDEEPPEEWFRIGGHDQLTSRGKERMYLLGKFLKLRYYDRLLAGNPRKLYARSENTDKSLESTQALIAGLNPPQTAGPWVWSEDGDSAHNFASSWQPKAIHTMPESQDDLLSSQTKCLRFDAIKATWKNSTSYLKLLNEFRHDLQILRQNTRLDFEDDLEMIINIDEHLKARSTLDNSQMPTWYTSTFAERLSHIADVAAGCRFSQESSQRLFIGRLLNSINSIVFRKIRSDLTDGISLLNDNNDDLNHKTNDIDDSSSQTLNEQLGRVSNSSEMVSTKDEDVLIDKIKMLPPKERSKLRLMRQNEPNVFVYMTDKQHLTALMNSLSIYSSQPNYGATLMFELHFDPLNQVHFLRLFAVNSASHNVLPEPVRVNPIACSNSVECSPQQFERNTRHLTLDKQSWADLCLNIDKYEHDQLLQQLITTTSLPNSVFASTTNDLESGPEKEPEPTPRSDNWIGTTESIELSTTTVPSSTASDSRDDDNNNLDKLDESLVVRPTGEAELNSIDQHDSSSQPTMEANETKTSITETSTAKVEQAIKSTSPFSTDLSTESMDESNVTTTTQSLTSSDDIDFDDHNSTSTLPPDVDHISSESKQPIENNVEND